LTNRIRGTYHTDAGMLCVWNPTAFTLIVDYDTWEAQLFEDDDIAGHISSGVFVPINIGSDGAFDFEMRVGDLMDLSSSQQESGSISAFPRSFTRHFRCEMDLWTPFSR
jgi:hypothetical protein